MEQILTVELNKQISKHNYYVFLWHAVFLALAINFMGVNTIILAMMVDAGGSSLQLGIASFGFWKITEFGFTLFFILFTFFISLSFYFIYKIDCKK